jgi:hypothetical protein
MATENLQNRMINFLTRQRGVDWCDACLAAKLDVKVPEIAEASMALSKTGVFYRSRWQCGSCGVRSAVTRWLANRPAPAQLG